MRKVLELLRENLGDWTFVDELQRSLGKGKQTVDQLTSEGLTKYCTCGCMGFMITEEGIEHLKREEDMKNSFKGTKGNWSQRSMYDSIPLSGNFALTCGVPPEEAKANARLAIRAPELLEALEAALEWIDAVPKDIPLPTMPGFDRDSVDNLINEAKS